MDGDILVQGQRFTSQASHDALRLFPIEWNHAVLTSLVWQRLSSAPWNSKPTPKCGHLPVSPLRSKPPVSLLTSRRGPHSLAKPPSLTLPVRYTAGTASLALFVSLLYILHAIRNRPLLIRPTYLDDAYWLCVSRRSFALSHTMRQCNNLLSQGQVGRRGFLPWLELGDRGRPDPRPRQLRKPSGCFRKKPLIWYAIRTSRPFLLLFSIILSGWQYIHYARRRLVHGWPLRSWA